VLDLRHLWLLLLVWKRYRLVAPPFVNLGNSLAAVEGAPYGASFVTVTGERVESAVADTVDAPPVNGPERRKRGQLRQTIGRTLRLAWQADHRTFVFVILLTVVPAAVPPVMVELSKRLVDLIAAAQLRRVDGDDVLVLVLVLGVLSALQRVAGSLMGTRQELFGRRVYLEALRRFLRQAATVDLGHFDNSDWHDRVARAQRDINWRPGEMTWALIGMTGNLVTLLGMLGILFSLHPVLVALVLISIAPVVVIQQRVNKKIYGFWWVETPEDRERTYLSELLSQPRTAKEIRSFALHDHFGRRQAELGENHYQKMARLYRMYDRYALLTAVIAGGALAAAYGFVGSKGIAGELTPGAITAVIAAFAAVTQQLNLLTSSLVSLDQHATFLDDYFSFLAIDPLLPVAEVAVALPESLDDGVRFEGVHFQYPGGTEPALTGLDLHVRAGELLALVGDNGAGKTSLVKLLLRFYDPTGGRVLVGGVDLRDVSPEELRSRIGVLFQDYATYELSARENVVLGRAERAGAGDDAAVQQALASARASSVIDKLPHGLDSKVGRLFEGGHDLSGGEWQRLALARLLFRDADIWILDEPTSALDPEAEAAIFAELREHLEGRIGLVISHRFSTVRIADRIAVVNDGEVQELGTHEELLTLGGRYAELFELQAAGYR
jgi:ATP-binding cassette subfamily B protein